MHEDEQLEEKPLAPEVERVRRKLMRLMLVSVAITMVLILAVLGAVVYKIMTPASDEATVITEQTSPIPPVAAKAPPANGQVSPTKITLPAGAKIISQSLSGNYLSLQILTTQQTVEFLIYDYNLGQFVHKVTVEN